MRAAALKEARSYRITGVVQGVGFRPFVYRLAQKHALTGWVLNAEDGVQIHVEGGVDAIDAFANDVVARPPRAARIVNVESHRVPLEGCDSFAIVYSERRAAPSVHVSPDLPVCDACLGELFDPNDRRYRYPYINCTDCGPRYSIVCGLPYDRPQTTMRDWQMCAECLREYENPNDRRFHAQPLACPKCGPAFVLEKARDGCSASAAANAPAAVRGDSAIAGAADLLRAGRILAIKGIGGYHLACDARNAAAVRALRERKYRKERPFAVMARDVETARGLIEIDRAGEALLQSSARPIVLLPKKMSGENAANSSHASVAHEAPAHDGPHTPLSRKANEIAFDDIAPENDDLGMMLPYTPLHHLLFASGAPDVLVMTSANRSSEPIAYKEDDALKSLAGIADAFVIGEREIARRVDDSVTRVVPTQKSVHGLSTLRDTTIGDATVGEQTMVLRHSRGYAPRSVARLPAGRPIVALGADLKNAIAVVVRNEVFVSQHVGDLEHFEALQAFRQTISDLSALYELPPDDVVVAHDAHPEYASAFYAREMCERKMCIGTVAVQHHRAHIASVMAEHGALEQSVLGFAFDGTGYGDDGTIWGGEVFTGSVASGFSRVAHLRPAKLPGGDAAARFPVQAATGFLDEIVTPDLRAAPFHFPGQYETARELLRKNVRVFSTTSVGRLFDTVGALVGFTRPITFEGQAAMWVEHLARTSSPVRAYSMPFNGSEFDYRPLLTEVVRDRMAGRSINEIARAFHQAIVAAMLEACEHFGQGRIAISGGVFQNALLFEELRAALGSRLWTNAAVPPNDGGICLGQAAFAAIR